MFGQPSAFPPHNFLVSPHFNGHVCLFIAFQSDSCILTCDKLHTGVGRNRTFGETARDNQLLATDSVN